jgi:hypothetical protein
MLLLLGLLMQIWLGLSWLQGFEVSQEMQCCCTLPMQLWRMHYHLIMSKLLLIDLRESKSGPSQNVYNSWDVTAWVQ